MDYNERAKKDLIDLDIDDIKEDDMNQKYQLRKKHNQELIMERRKKRIGILNESNIKENSININIESNNVTNKLNKDKKIFLEPSDFLNNNEKLNKISEKNIEMILDCLKSEDINKNQWIIYSLRIYFEKNNPELNEYLLFFENNINIYLEALLKKYHDTIYIVNEILIIITNLFSYDEIINKFPEKYFLFFLTNSYLTIYTEQILTEEEEIIISILLLLTNILIGKKTLIKKIFDDEEFIYSIIDIIKEKETLYTNIAFYFVKFFKMVLQSLSNDYIKNKNLFYLILDKIFIIYKKCDKVDIIINKNIILLIIDSLKCYCKDKNDIEEYFAFNYLFEERNDDIMFIHYFCSSLYNNTHFYFSDNTALIDSLNLLKEITFNCNNAQMECLFNSNEYNYNLLDLANKYYQFMIKDNSNYIIQLLELCINIIDTDLYFALQLIFSLFFGNLIIYFSENITNKKILDKYLDLFIRLLGYNNKNIAENLFKRGIIYEAIFCKLLCGCDNSILSFNNEMILKMLKIIVDYLEIALQPLEKEKFTREDFLLLNSFKEFVLTSKIISEETRDCLIHLEYMNNI